MIPASKPFSALSLKNQEWILSEPPMPWVQKLAEVFALSPATAHLLALRADTLEKAEAFLSPSLKNHFPDPECLPDIKEALICLLKAIQKDTCIGIWGDYDVDGATSSALWKTFLTSLGCTTRTHIPDRFHEGYGPNIPGIEALAEEGIKTLIIVDCGTTAFEPLERAQELGLKVIVIDHHAPESILPPCIALINPKRLDASPEAQAFTSLAAVGLSFCVLVALNRFLREQKFYTSERPEPSLLPYLDSVALGTVCDVMPLTGINRILVKKGIQIMRQRGNLGLKTLMDVAGLKEAVSSYHLGFVLGPRINAGGRIGASDLGTRLLTTSSPQEALSLATQLNTLNQERQQIEKTLEIDAIEQGSAQESHPCIVAAGDGWHQGVIGIIASRLKDRFHKPSFVIGWDTSDENSLGKGSARSIPGLDLGSLIHEARLKGHILSGGGHAMAGGFSLTRTQFPSFQTFLQEKIRAFFPALPSPTLSITAPLTLSALNHALLEEIAVLEPFGQGNPRAMWLFHDLWLQNIIPVGETHLRLNVRYADRFSCTAMAFRSVGTPIGDFLLARPSHPFSIAGTIQKNTYNNQIQIIVEDIRI